MENRVIKKNGHPTETRFGVHKAAIINDPKHILPNGTRLGSGVVTKVVGSGGTSIIYEILHRESQSKRAVKLIRPDYTPETLELFKSEIRICSKLDHPNIVGIFNAGKFTNLPYIEMEMIDGAPLSQLIKKGTPLPVSFCTAVGIYLCRGLNYIHNFHHAYNGREYKGIIHRDIKPGNVMVSEDGKVKLMDFGIALPMGVHSLPNESSDMVGSIAYIAPEQLIKGSQVDARADIFALGCILYEMVAGRKVFPSSDPNKLFQARIDHVVPSVSSLGLPLPPKLASIIDKCLDRNPKNRPPNSRVILRQLESIHRNLTSLSHDEAIMRYIICEKYGDGPYISPLPSRLRIRKAVFAILPLVAVCAGALLFHGKDGNIWRRWESVKKTMNRMTQPEVALPVPEKHIQRAAVPETKKGTVPLQDTKPPKQKMSAEVAKRKQPRKAPGGTSVPEITASVKHTPRDISSRQKSTVHQSNRLPAVTRKPAPTRSVPETPKAGSYSLVQKLAAQYGTSDLRILYFKEAETRNYDNVLTLYGLLPEHVALDETILLIKLRAIMRMDTVKADFFAKHQINDAEYFIAKSEFLHSRKQYANALSLLDSADACKATLLDKHSLAARTTLLRAQCLTGLFYMEGTKQNLKAAMNGWTEVMKIAGYDSDHQYMQTAESTVEEIMQEAKLIGLLGIVTF